MSIGERDGFHKQLASRSVPNSILVSHPAVGLPSALARRLLLNSICALSEASESINSWRSPGPIWSKGLESTAITGWSPYALPAQAWCWSRQGSI